MAKERMQSGYERSLRFGLIGLVGGIAAAAGLVLPIWLMGGTVAGGDGPIRALLIGFPVGGFVGGMLMGMFREGLGALVERPLQSRGRSPAEYSHARSLVARGAYREAVVAYETAASDNPTDPEPLILGAHVLQHHLQQYASAVEWLCRARRIADLSPHHDITITRALVDLYDGPVQRPEKAIPELARVVETYPDTNAADWARNELSRLRAAVWTDLKEARRPRLPPPPPRA